MNQPNRPPSIDGVDDARLHDYFERQADRVSLPDGDPHRVVARAHRRRHTRRALTGAAATVVLLLGVVGIYAGRTEQDLTVAAPGSTTPAGPASTLRWTAVDVPSGLGWTVSDPVATSTGSIYSLSTAPGRVAPSEESMAPVLYRSTDGQRWATASLPTGLRPTALATSPGHLYAVGTAPGGGGGIDLVVASTTDDAATWTESRVPSPVADLMARFPRDVQVSGPRVANGPAGLIAALTVVAFPDVDRLLAKNDIVPPNGWSSDASGVTVYKTDGCGTPPVVSPTRPPLPSTTVVGDPAGAATLEAQKLEAQRVEREAKAAPGGTVPVGSAGTVPAPEGCAVKGEPAIERTYTWADLRLEPELQALLEGKLHVYTSPDGQSFTPVAPGGVPGIGGGHLAGLIGSTDGYRVMVGAAQSSLARHAFSTDGRTWTVTGSFDGWVQSLGHLGTSAAALVSDKQGTSLLTAAAGGGWNSTSVSAAVQAATGAPDAAVGPASFGPLGFVGLVMPTTDADSMAVVESTGGTSFAVRRLSDLGAPGAYDALGISMNADAVVIRLGTAPGPGADPNTAPLTQRLLVGTRT